MATGLNLQRNSEVYMSTIDLASGAAYQDMTSRNTWRLEVLAGYAASQSAATQDITSLESGLTPDRSAQRFNTAINPVEWSLQAYLRPTGVDAIATDEGNVMPVADWYMWQALMSNTSFASGAGGNSVVQSAWQDSGKFELANRAASTNVAQHNPNFASAVEYHLYIKMDNVHYQVKNASVNEGSIDAAIDGIATTSWSGFGTDFVELTGDPRDNLVLVTGGVLNNGTSVAANSNANASSTVGEYHLWGNYLGTEASFIKNRLSSIELKHTPDGGAESTYTFPVTGLGFTFSNAITYLTPEELAALNVPIGQFTGSRTINGNFTAYLRVGADESAQFLRNIVNDRRTSISDASSANLKIGGATAPYMAIDMPAVNFNFPTHSVEDILSISVEFLAQETTAGRGTGNELTLYVAG